jgi:predicted deacylase
MKKQVYTKTVDDFIKPELAFHLFGEGAPRVFFTGGIHGGEATGIYVAQRVIEFLEENELLKGSVKVLPIANPTAFRHLERSSPYDRLDLNRIFPGRTGSAPLAGCCRPDLGRGAGCRLHRRPALLWRLGFQLYAGCLP